MAHLKFLTSRQSRTRQLKAILADNHYQISENSALLEAEEIFVLAATVHGIPSGDYSLEHIAQVHHHLFSELYPWAGQASFSKGNCRSRYALDSDTGAALATLRSLCTAEMSASDFATAMASSYLALEMSNPFEHGSSRTIRSLLGRFAHERGMNLDWSKTCANELTFMVESALRGDTPPLVKCFKMITRYLDLYSLGNCSVRRSSPFYADIDPRYPTDDRHAAGILLSIAKAHARSLARYHGSSGLISRWASTSIHGLSAWPSSTCARAPSCVEPSSLEMPALPAMIER